MKLTKREFVKVGAALTLTPAALLARPALSGLVSTPVAAAPRWAVFIYDDRFPHACEIARTIPAASVLATGGDAGRLWYERLRALAGSSASRPVAGLTTHTDLLILETLARESGLKVRQRDSQGRLVSWVMS